MKACIIANGSIPSASTVRKIIGSCDMIICADGGANHAAKLRITPDLIIGDLDSISSTTKRLFKAVSVILQKEQYSTDLEKAIRYCISHHFDSADIIGATGGRIDHTVGNLGCFRKFGKRIQLRMIDEQGELSLIHKNIQFRTRKGALISLIPLNRCSGITTSNLKYPLRNGTLELGVREGTHNVATSATVCVSVKKGTLLLYILH